VVTNCSPNHLDWHPDYDDYRRAKQRLVTQLPADGAAVLNLDDAEVAAWRPLVRAQLAAPFANDAIPVLSIPGGHNRQNARLAAAAAAIAGASARAIAEGLAGFQGLAHRLERVAQIAGRTFYNDSLATTPESAQVALQAFEAPVWLLAGGSDKGADFAELAGVVARRAKGSAFYGQTGSRLAALVRSHQPRGEVCEAATLAQAFQWAWSRSSPGEVILLSPACASFDQFQNFAERGQAFRAMAAALDRTAP
jgi:UDP-N-acetylmuramoylalanine--D-glutamate ligase